MWSSFGEQVSGLGLLNCPCKSQYAQMHTGDMTVNSSRPAQNVDCLIRGWKAKQFGQLFWPSFIATIWVYGCIYEMDLVGQ